jgi:hypothetical protein
VAGHVGDPGLDQPGGDRHGNRAGGGEPETDADRFGADGVIVDQQPDPVDPAQADESGGRGRALPGDRAASGGRGTRLELLGRDIWQPFSKRYGKPNI